MHRFNKDRQVHPEHTDSFMRLPTSRDPSCLQFCSKDKRKPYTLAESEEIFITNLEVTSTLEARSFHSFDSAWNEMQKALHLPLSSLQTSPTLREKSRKRISCSLFTYVTLPKGKGDAKKQHFKESKLPAETS